MLDLPKAKVSILVHTLNNLTTILSGLIVTPLMVKSFGSVMYGQFIVINQAITYLSLFDIGNASFLKYELARSNKSSNNPKKNRLITAALISQILTLPFQIAIIGVALSYTPNQEVVAGIKTEKLGQLTILLSIAYIVGRMTAPFSYILFGCNKDHITAGKKLIEQTLQLILDILTLSSGLSVRWFAANRIITNVIGATSMIFAAKNAAKWFKIEIPTKIEIVETIKSNAQYLVQQWGTIFSECVDIATVGLLFGPTTAALFSLTMSLPRILVLTLSSIFTVGIPAASIIHSDGNKNIFSNIYNQTQRFGIICLGIAAAPVAALNQAFVNLWVGNSNFAGQILTNLGILLFVLFALTRLNLGTLMAAGMFRAATTYQLLSSALGLLIIILMKPLAHVYAIPIGLIAGRLCMIISAKRLLISKGHTLNNEPRLYIVFIFTNILAGFLGKSIGELKGWTTLILIAPIISIGTGILLLFLGLQKTTRSEILQKTVSLVR